jgi:signal transduction histidine kinase
METRMTSRPESAPPRAPAEDVRILVVDDHPENLVALRAVLEGLGHVVGASSGKEALRCLLEGDFAVLLLDVQMNGMDGYETARMIRQRDKNRDTPIIFITAVLQADDHVQRGYAAGAVDYVFKPIQTDVLRAKVAVFVELAKQRRQLEVEIERRRRAEAEVRAMAGDLERRIAERTRELETANADLRAQMEVTAQLRRQLEMASQRKDEFLAVLGHELRNPLAAMANASGALDALDPAHPAAGDMKAIITRQVHRLGRLVDDLLDVARITRGTLSLRKERIDLREIAERAVVAVRPVMESKGHVLEVALPDSAVIVDGDPVRLEQVVTNLLDNAAKYTPENGHVWLSLGIDADSTRGRALLTVRDDGPGVTPQVRGRMFELFSRGDGALESGISGFGVGLALCKQLIELHGGTITLRPGHPGRGSQFVVEVPLASARTTEAVKPVAEAKTGTLARNVLIVEDNADAAASLMLMLQAWGSVAEVAPDGDAAIEAVSRRRPDLVLLDIALPGADGYDVARRLRGKLGDAVRLVAVTGFGRDQDRRRALEAGCNEHLTKPIAPSRLRALVLGEVQ